MDTTLNVDSDSTAEALRRRRLTLQRLVDGTPAFLAAITNRATRNAAEEHLEREHVKAIALELAEAELRGDTGTSSRLASLLRRRARAEDPWVALKDGAAYANCLGADGDPLERYYKAVREALGPRKQIRRSELDRLICEGKL